MFKDLVFSDCVQAKSYFRRSEKVNFSFADVCCKKVSASVKKKMNQISDNYARIRSLGAILALLMLAVCCTGFHSFEECSHETATQEVELLSAREDDEVLATTRNVFSFFGPLETASTRCLVKSPTYMLVSERSAINGLGTYLRL